ncbi:putative quinol monooxygenase [Anaerocolumna sp. AGMB13020]|uniref:putative quinol monooxygenase n=1 Tax=Anaerocolumna sp. AGMB13020 TaxID=3081750 RepID=UPI002955235A|nr:putative quinol monooxygenase [Anaerocolumna sp. AGMB13020]WOO37997.1 putative quinol monooxygenase [Anaerocolumna sp. AGMB13020]
MIKVIVPSIIKENHLSDALQLYELLVKETVKEQGCISYELFQALDDPNSLTLIEEWEDEQALHRHTKTPHFINLVGKLAEYEQELPIHICKKLF